MHTVHRTLTILDPTSLLGREVTAGVAGAFPGARRILLHTGTEPEHLIAEVADGPALVPPLTDPAELDGSAAVVVTAQPPASTALRLIEWLRAQPTTALIDCTQPGIAPGEAVSVIDAPPAGHAGLPWFHLVDPSLAAPARVLRALLPLRPEEFFATLLSPASRFGAAAVEELAAQGAARLSGAPAHRPAHLPAVLAFDVAPARGERQAAIEGQLAELFAGIRHGVQLVDAGVFHGDLAAVQVRCARVPSLENVRALLRATPGVRLARRNETPTVSAAADGGDTVCGGVRVLGSTVTAWVLADGLRVGGAGAVLELLGSLSAT